jgi:hypothetical protein
LNRRLPAAKILNSSVTIGGELNVVRRQATISVALV